jgi:TonB family protein
MPITQIPFQDPVAPPEKSQPEQLGLYDTRDWETAYRELDAKVPHLLIQLQDDLTQSRRREAAWISIIMHLLLFIVLWNFKLIEGHLWHPAIVVPLSAMKDKDVTFLALPPDAQKLTHKPNTNVMSDKDRVAMTPHPELDPKELRKILATPPPGAPGRRGPRAPAAAPPQAMAQNQSPAQEPSQQPSQQASPPPQFESDQTAQLRMPSRPDNSFSKYAGSMTAGSAIQQAEQAAAARRAAGTGGQGGDFGLGTGAHGRAQGSLEILSDTMGVDFGAYLERVRIEIYKHWYEVLPESVMPPTYKKGQLMIEFAILADGRVAGMQLVAPSGDDALDRAAWGGITGSNPFPPLPTDFTKLGGRYLSLRCTFTYNMDVRDLR